MYSEELQGAFDDHDIEVGDRIQVETADETYEGRLMPRSSQGDTNAIVLKLDNGYNLGVVYDDDTELSLVEEHDIDTATRPDVPEQDESKTNIMLLHTGGTIASRVSYAEGGVEPALEPEDLYEIYPELFDLANVESHVVAQMYSGDMEPEHWVQIAEAVAEHREEADGIIIGHGTDTMAYTAAALSFMLENIDIPVVLVGAQRSSDRPSTDATVNMLSAAQFVEEEVPGVYVCMHASMSDKECAIHRGTKVRKMHTSRRDAFKSIDAHPVATVKYPEGDVTWHEDIAAPDGAFSLRTELDTNVGLLKTVPGLNPDIFQHYEQYNGIILEGTGLGHFPVNSFDDATQHHEDTLSQISEMADDGLVAMASQCLYGTTNMNVYQYGVKLKDAGVIESGDMLPGVAYVKMMWALGQTDSIEAAKELFTTNIAGELQGRREYDDF